jgi:hypothetical protein
MYFNMKSYLKNNRYFTGKHNKIVQLVQLLQLSVLRSAFFYFFLPQWIGVMSFIEPSFHIYIYICMYVYIYIFFFELCRFTVLVDLATYD